MSVIFEADGSGECNILAGDTAFMMFASTVVMIQTPAMGLTQAGMIRRKNSLSMLMQVLFGMVIGSLLWVTLGFSMSFGDSLYGVIGNPLHYFLLRDIPVQDCIPEFADTIPAMLFVAFQMMFALMAPLIVTGSWVEKLSFDAFLIFMVTWPVIVYYPLVHWVWNPNGWLNKLGVIDFAGGLVIHLSTGAAGFVVSLVLQHRKLHTAQLTHHNLPLSFVGAMLVWSGWYSFNGGSAYKANYQAATALVNTHLSACAGALTWTLWNRMDTKKWSLIEAISGAFAGLGGITAGSGFVLPDHSMIIGATCASAAFWSVRFFKGFMRLDDVLDVTSLQGVAGMVGSVLVGCFATNEMPVPNDVNGLFYGGGLYLLKVQMFAALVVVAWSGCWTYIILAIMKKTVGIDISVAAEEEGLDLAQIGEQAYDQRLDLKHDLGDDTLVGILCGACKTGDVEEVKMLIAQGADPHQADYDGRYPIHLAAASGHLNILDFLFHRHYVDLNVTDTFGGTPLLDALYHGHREAVKWLRKHGATMDAVHIDSELFDACAMGNIREIQGFIEAEVDINMLNYDMRTPLMVAASSRNGEIVRALLDAGASQDFQDRWGRTAFDWAVDSMDPTCLDLLGVDQDMDPEDMAAILAATNEETPLLHHENAKSRVSERVERNRASHRGSTGREWRSGKPASFGTESTTEKRSSLKILRERQFVEDAHVRVLNVAAAQGNLGDLQNLISKGSNPGARDYDMRTALHVAACNGHFDVVKYLCSQECIKKGVDINAVDRWRHTPLSEAARHGSEEIVAFLREQGAVTVNPYLGHALCLASSKNDIPALRKFENQGCNLSTCDYDGRTPLHLAASNGHLEAVEFLLGCGVHRRPRDRLGFTPLKDAMREGHEEVIALLREGQDEFSFWPF